MSRLMQVLMAGVLGMTVFSGWGARAEYYPCRQYYSSWAKHSTYYYRIYYYKPSYEWSGYRHHYVCYYPEHPEWFYYYNPYKQQFWGRCPSHWEHGVGQYSMLPEPERKPILTQIPEAAFPKAGPVPHIPEASDEIPLDLPPDDLPGPGPGPGSGPEGLPKAAD